VLGLGFNFKGVNEILRKEEEANTTTHAKADHMLLASSNSDHYRGDRKIRAVSFFL
jgi:hypothetical protein